MHPGTNETESAIDEAFENIVVSEQGAEEAEEVVQRSDPPLDDDWMSGEFDIT